MKKKLYPLPDKIILLGKLNPKKKSISEAMLNEWGSIKND